MIIGAHVMLQSRDEAADRSFLSDVLKFSAVDAGGGFMIFAIPPAEVAIHGSDKNDVHQLFLMCEDISEFTADMSRRGIAFTPPANQGWGTLTEITLPGGGKLGIYQPHHRRPRHPAPKAAKRAATKTSARKKPSRRTPPKKVKTRKRR